MGSQWHLINENYKKLDGYKRVAWPPVSEERIIREFTPQPQVPPSGGPYSQQPVYNQPEQQQHQQQQQQQHHQQPQQQHQQSAPPQLFRRA